MHARFSVNESCGYVVTDAGRREMAQEARCACRITFVGNLIQCPDCGTVYGLVADVARIVQRQGIAWKRS